MERYLLPPADDAASDVLLLVQTATTQVKQLVTEGVSHGVKEEELVAQLNAAISSVCREIADVGLREQVKKSLVTAARKWHYELSNLFRILDANLQRKQPLRVDVGDLFRKTPYERMREFRTVLDDGNQAGLPIIRDYQQSVRTAVRALSAEPPKIITPRGGRAYAMPVRLRAEMAVRYAAAVENLQRLVSEGALFCWISSHASCSPRCADFQGKLYSLFQGKIVLDGKEYGESGTIDGIPYRPINEALAGKNGDGNGCISGYNCRHRAVEYKRGSRPPQDFTEATMRREYAVDKQQRSYENRIRQMKTEERLLRAVGMTEEASALRKKWRLLTLEYQEYSISHDRAYYPYRCVIDKDEMGLEVLTNTTNYDIMSTDQVAIEVDIATPCLVDKKTGAIVKTEMELVDQSIVKKIDRTHEYGFLWSKVVRDHPNCSVAVLHVKGESHIEGVVAYEKVKSDNAYVVYNVEKPKRNRGVNGKYAGVAKHLFAYVSKIAFDDGCDCVEFQSKSRLIGYYQKTLNARIARGQWMYLEEQEMKELVEIYYPEGDKNEEK